MSLTPHTHHRHFSDDWSERDETLLLTAQAVNACLHNEIDRLPGLATDFAVPGQYPDNKIFGSSPFSLHSFEAAGSAEYAHNSSAFFALGRGGLALTAAFFAARGIRNARRRKTAERNAEPRWQRRDSGILFVNQFGFYMRTPTDLLVWHWDAIVQGRMIEPGMFAFLGDSTRGRVHLVVESDAAELVFACWALTKVPNHPQLLEKIWLPPDWLQRYSARFGVHGANFVALADDGMRRRNILP